MKFEGRQQECIEQRGLKTREMKDQPHQIVLEYNFDLHQKIHLSFYAAFCLLAILELRNLPVDLVSGLYFLFFFAVFLLFVMLIFSRKGFVIKKNRLYRTSFFSGIPLHKQRVELQARPVISILKFKKKQKLIFFSIARPNLSHGFNAFDIYLLNERHTRKNKLLSLKKEVMAIEAANFLIAHTSLKKEAYSPQFANAGANIFF